MRTEIAEKVVGSHSYILRVLLHVFFTSRGSFSRAGALVDGPTDGEHLVIFASNFGIIADGKAHKQNYSIKGASGMMPCDTCSNLVAKGLLDPSNPSHIPNPDGDLVDICCPSLARCKKRSSDDIFNDADVLHRLYPRMIDRTDREIRKVDFEHIEMSTGITYNPHGVLWDVNLRGIAPPLETVKKDWAHIYLCKGIVADEMWTLFARLKTVGVTHLDIKTEMERYTWPQHHRTGTCVNAWTAFGEKRWASSSEAKTFKIGASESLSIFPVVLVVAAKYQDRIPAEYKCFRTMCEIVDTILAMKCGHVEINEETCHPLHERIEAHFASHLELYGNANVTPKWHDSLHLATQFLADGQIFDTLTNERNHQNPKAFADVMKGHLPAFDRSVLARSVAFQLKRLAVFSDMGVLRGRTQWSHAIDSEIGSAISCNGMHVAVGEFVLWNGKVIRVQRCGKTRHGELFMIGTTCHVLKHTICVTAVDMRGDTLELIWPSEEVVRPAKCWKLGNETAQLIFPLV